MAPIEWYLQSVLKVLAIPAPLQLGDCDPGTGLYLKQLQLLCLQPTAWAWANEVGALAFPVTRNNGNRFNMLLAEHLKVLLKKVVF